MSSSLQWTNLSIPFGRGVDTKNDDKNIKPPFLADLQNGVFDRGGSIVKRNGYMALPRQIGASPDRLDKGVAIDTYKSELLLFDNSQMYSYSPTSMTWQRRGRSVSLKGTATPILRNSFGQAGADMALLGNIAVYTWEDTRGGVRATSLDTSTGSAFVSDVLISSAGYAPRCVAGDDYVYIFFIEADALKVYRLAKGNPTQFFLASSVATNKPLNSIVYDVCRDGDAIKIAYRDADQAGVVLAYITTNGFVGVVGNGYPQPVLIPFDATKAVSIRAVVGSEGAGYLAVLMAGATQLRLGAYDANFTLYADFAAAALTAGVPSADAYNLDAIAIDADQQAAGANTLTLRLVVDVDGATPTDHLTYQATVRIKPATAGALVSTNTVLKGAGLAARIFYYDRVAYVPVAYDSPLQASYFLMDTAGNLLSKHLPSVAGGLPLRQGVLGQMVSPADGQFAFAGLQKGITRSEGATLFSLLGVSKVAIDFKANGRYQSAQLGDLLYILGGMLMVYDGINLVEDGFTLFPEDIGVATFNTGGAITNGDRLYRAVYAWTDNTGQRHRSAPSAPLAVTFAGGGSAQRAEVVVPTLKVTNKTDVLIEIYRSTGDGVIYYKTTTVGNTPLNDPTVDAVTFNDIYSDVAISSNEILYTNGGTLDNDAPPQFSAICSSKNRLMGIPSETPLSLYYTKEYTAGDAPGWSLALTKAIPAQGFEAQAVATLDDKVVIFKQDRLFGFAGQGPNNAGLEDNFSDIDLISADTGCKNPDSIVLTSDGLIFQSDKGVRLLDRSLGLADVGAAAQAYSVNTLTSAVLLQDNDQVRFTTEANRALAYDYYWKAETPDGRGASGQWSTFTNHQGVDAINWRGTYTYLRPDGRVFIETPGVYLDDGQQIVLKIVTAWLQPNGPQGYVRVRRAEMLGNYKSPHKILTQIAYDYADFSTRQVFDTAIGLNITTWGGDAKWGSSTPWGGNSDSVYQFRINPSRQKCQSIRFSFEDIPNPENLASGAGQAYSLNNLSLEVGGKKGLFKLGDKKTAKVG